MCNACVIENVKQSMLSRRSLFAGAAAAGVALTAGVPARAQGPSLPIVYKSAVDLTYTFDEAFPTFDGKPGIAYERDKDIAKDGYNIWKITFFEHSGTHVDAPLHFTADGKSVAELEPARLVCPLCIVDLKSKATDDPNAMVEAEDIEAWISANGDLPPGAFVAMNSGWQAKFGTPAFRTDEAGKFAFPGFGKSATDLLAEAGAAAIGVDTLSLDPGNSADFAVHNAWLSAGNYGVENLANLDGLPAKGATIVVGAPKHARGTGGPARVLALVP